MERTLPIELSSQMATAASLLRSRYSSASGPNSIDSGIATAPIWNTAMYAIAVSNRCGITIATRSPRRTPSAASAWLRRSADRCSAP